MKIAFFELEEWEKQYIETKFGGNQLNLSDEKITADTAGALKDVDILSIFIYSEINEPILNAMPKLKLICTRSTGFDHIDLDACKRHNVIVCNVPTYGENTVAEHTFALILSISRRLFRVCSRFEPNFSLQGLLGFDLKGKTLGVVGTGQIGLHVIRIAKGFGMDVLAYDLKQNHILSEILGFNYVSLENLLPNSDIVTLHVPYNKYTHHLMNRDRFKLMRKGSIMINTARGAIVDTEALIEALDQKILSGAGLDVIEGEELIKEEKQIVFDPKKIESLASIVKDHILLNKDNVVFTPHIAFYSKEALERILDTTVDNINAFISGKPQNMV